MHRKVRNSIIPRKAMTGNVSVPCMAGDEEIALPISYEIEMHDGVHVITCSMPGNARVPTWLHVRKFELRSIVEDAGYTPLYTYQENVKNMETLVFIEKAYELVMIKEQLKIMA